MRPLTHLVILTALALPLYALNPTSLGLFTTQEAIRANVGREMQRAGSWIVPVRRGSPYLAKPPMVYWSQRVIAAAHGAEVSELDTRLNAAIWAWAGVIATYLVGRRMLRRPGLDHDRRADAAAFLGALFLELGVAYCHNGRAGELDIMLVAPVVVCIGAVHHAWTGFLSTGRTRWGTVGLATLAATAAALIKGPPPMMVIALGGYAPVLLSGLFTREGRSAASLFKQAQSVHPLLVLGVPLLVFWGWLRLAAFEIGPEKLKQMMEIEVEDNLRMFELAAWGNNIGAVSWSLGGFAVAGAAGMVVLTARWKSLTRGQLMLAAWFVLGFVGFSLTTKGVGRYLLPILPALALAGGWIVRQRLEADRRSGALRAAVIVVAVAQGGVLIWWGMFGRTASWSDRSPRDFMRELLTKADPSRMGTLNYKADALDYYADQALDIWGRDRFGRPLTELAERLRAEVPFDPNSAGTPRPYTLLVVEEIEANQDRFGSAADALRNAGLDWTEIPVRAEHRKPPGNARLLAWSVRPAAGPGADTTR